MCLLYSRLVDETDTLSLLTWPVFYCTWPGASSLRWCSASQIKRPVETQTQIRPKENCVPSALTYLPDELRDYFCIFKTLRNPSSHSAWSCVSWSQHWENLICHSVEVDGWFSPLWIPLEWIYCNRQMFLPCRSPSDKVSVVVLDSVQRAFHLGHMLSWLSLY